MTKIRTVSKAVGVVLASYAAGALLFLGFVATAIALENAERERRVR